jgi:hypothetical protein
VSAVKNRAALAELRAKIGARTAAPLDMTGVHANISLALVAHHQGRQRKGESVLSAFARALSTNPAKLFDLAYRDRKRFRAKYLALLPHFVVGPNREWPYEGDRLAKSPARDALADDGADEIVRSFLAEEITHQLCEAAIADAGPWLANMMGAPGTWPGLCRQRPCRPV